MLDTIQDVQHYLILFRCFCRDWNSPVNKLRQENLKALREVLLDLGRPFSCHYGAIIGLTTFGRKVKCSDNLGLICLFLTVNITNITYFSFIYLHIILNFTGRRRHLDTSAFGILETSSKLH